MPAGDAPGVRPAPGWVIVAGGFHDRGGMDKANRALAVYLARSNSKVDLVSHFVDSGVGHLPGVTVHLVPRPAGSFAAGELLLDLAGRRVARAAISARPGTRVVVNGGNCCWPDVNWVHAVHHAWPPADGGTPFVFRLKNRATKKLARMRERRAIPLARFVVSNSERTKSDLVRTLGIGPGRVRTVYLGADENARPATGDERRRAREWLGCGDAAGVVAFVGPLGRDRNKGFDTLFRVWREFAREAPGVHLVAAGAGASEWKAQLARASGDWARRVHFAGFTDRVQDVLAASDLLVSPVRYEAYGLNVQEALCREIPVLVSRTAGIVERFPPTLASMILQDPDDGQELIEGLRRWLTQREEWRERVRPLAALLRAFTWSDMAAEFVSAVSGHEAVRL